MLASETIYTRIKLLDDQIERAREGSNGSRLDVLEAQRNAYVVDLMEVLNEEGAFTSRRSTDKFTPFNRDTTLSWIRERKAAEAGGTPIQRTASGAA